MNEPISILELIINASVVVQAVMALLVAASLASWVMIFQRGFALAAIRNGATEFENEFWSGKDLGELYREIEEQENEVVGLENIFASGFREYSRARQQEGMDPDRLMQNVQRAMRVALSREEERLETHLPFLATVGSTSPYIGLFGTVWGIMNAFIEIAEQQNTNLAVVAPGIAEALLATGLGLLAAIPAVIFYNKLSADSERIISGYESFADEFSTILSRQLDS